MSDGASYEVMKDAPGYEASCEDAAGMLDFSVSDMVLVSFVNMRNAGIPTGALSGAGLWLLMAGVLGIVPVKRRR